VAGEEIVTCLPVIQEVLQGIDDERAFQVARRAFEDIPILDSPLPPSVYDEAVTLYRSGRRAGITIRSSVDCLIAASAIRNGATVLHVDRDFTHLARVSRLKAKRI
jgi:predicted nucleic acid-binding protein